LQGISITRLNSVLKDATSLSELEQVEQQFGDMFDYIHISTAFTRCGHLASRAAAQSTSFHPLLPRLWHCLQPQLDDCDSQALGNIVWACGKAGYANADLLDSCIARLLEKAAAAKPQALANAVYSASLLQEHGYKINEQQALQLVVALMQKRQDATPQALANTLWAAATMGLQLHKQQAQQLVAALVQQREQANPQNLSNTALALAILGLHYAQLFAALTAAAKPKVQQFNAQDLSNMCWAVAVADQQQLVEEVVALVRRVGSAGMWSSTVAESLRQLYQVHLWLLDVQAIGSRSGLAGALSPAQLRQCRGAWEQQLDKTAQQRRTQLEQEVYQCCAQQLHSLLTDCRQAARTQDGALRIDVVAPHTASRKRLAIEADGPTHFLRPGRQVTGETVACNRALAARGYVVVSAPYWEWDELRKNTEGQAAYLTRKIEAALKVHMGGGGRGKVQGGAAAAA